MPLYGVERITIEVVSAIACFILVRYMIKPFRLTGEDKYLGLPLGFGFLGISYAFSALSYSTIISFSNWGWVQLLVRGLAFFFLLVTYYFSKSAKKPNILWKTTLGILIVILTILILLATISPQIPRSDYVLYYIGVRGFGFISLCYISIHALKNQPERTNLTTFLTPLAYILLAINQYSSIIWVVETSYLALFGGLAFRLAGLAIFLFVSYKSFYSSEWESK